MVIFTLEHYVFNNTRVYLKRDMILKEKYMLIIKIVLLVFITSFIYANPIIVTTTQYGGILYGGDLLLFHWVVIGWLVLSIEYLYLRTVLKEIPTIILLKYFVLINLITYPITCIVSLFIFIFAEVIPLYFEPKYLAKKLQNDSYSYKYIKTQVFNANLISFFIGAIVSILLSKEVILIIGDTLKGLISI